MKCVICKVGETQRGKTTVVLVRENMTLVSKGVPAEVCQNCGEAYVTGNVGDQLLRNAESAVQSGVEVEVREFVPTPA